MSTKHAGMITDRVYAEADCLARRVVELVEEGRATLAIQLLRSALLDEAIEEDEAAALLGLRPRTMQQQRQLGTGPRYFKVSTKKRGGVRYVRRHVLEHREQLTVQCTANVPAALAI